MEKPAQLMNCVEVNAINVHDKSRQRFGWRCTPIWTIATIVAAALALTMEYKSKTCNFAMLVAKTQT